MSGPNPVVVKFICAGVNDVLKAIKSISDAVNKTETTSTAVVKAQAATRTKAAKDEAKVTIAEIGRTSQMMQAAQKTGTKSVEKELKTRLENQIRHLNAGYDAEKASEAKKNAIRERSATYAGKFAKQQADAENAIRERSATYAGKFAKQQADAEIAEAARASAGKNAIRERSASMAGAFAKKQASDEASVNKALASEKKRARFDIQRGEKGMEPTLAPQARLLLLNQAEKGTAEEKKAAIERARDIATENKALEVGRKKAIGRGEIEDHLHIQKQITQQEEAATKNRLAIREKTASMAGKFAAKQAQEDLRTREKFASVVSGAGGTAIKSATSVAGRAIGGIMNLGGGFSVEDSLQREIQLQKHAAQMSTTTESGITKREFLEGRAGQFAGAREVGKTQGMDPDEVLRGYEAIKRLQDKDLAQGMRAMPDIAKIATATGTDLGQLGDLTANILAAVPDGQKLSDKDLMKQLRIFTRQGIEGGVEISDFAKYGTRITGAASLFGGNREENEVALGGVAQIARQRGTATTAAEASMTAIRLGTDLAAKAQHLKKGFGIDVLDGKGTMRNVEDILVDLANKDNTVEGISKFKLGQRADRAILGVADIHRSAGGGAAGEKAVRARFATFHKEVTEQAIEEKNKKVLAETSKQLDMAMIGLRQEVGTKLVPVLIPFVGVLTRAIPIVGKVIEGLMPIADLATKHPFAGFGAAVMAFFMKELAAAQIAKTIQALLSGPAAGPLGAAGGVLGKGLAVAGVGAAAALATREAIDYGFDEDKKKDSTRMGRQIEATNLASAARHGQMTPEMRKRAQELTKQLQGDIKDQQNEAKNPSWVKTITGGFGSVFDPKGTAEADKVAEQERVRAEAATQKSIADLVKALNANTKATNGNSGGGGGTSGAPAQPGVPSGNKPVPQRN